MRCHTFTNSPPAHPSRDTYTTLGRAPPAQIPRTKAFLSQCPARMGWNPDSVDASPLKPDTGLVSMHVWANTIHIWDIAKKHLLTPGKPWHFRSGHSIAALPGSRPEALPSRSAKAVRPLPLPTVSRPLPLNARDELVVESRGRGKHGPQGGARCTSPQASKESAT